MSRRNNIAVINELSASERVFTTAQAERLGVSRDALAKACASGNLVRVAHGAYRMAGVPPTELDELIAVWKLTKPALFFHERASYEYWDGIAVSGHTAASVLGIGDFYMSPYRLVAPRRMRSNALSATFATRCVEREDVSFSRGLPVTRPERTLVDLVLDDEDPSLVIDALGDARDRGLDAGHLEGLVGSACGRSKVGVATRLLLGEGASDAV
ncbi:MAG: type IV toxin-antitoxin system AbiEi family antitoxin domain-containing protein [Atopobiaceae bacterium]|nr:type IV toxin-antitoxin system AbiEi family antitoxin domain-containing protein [Atopobiaceae bacterium]